MEFMRSRPDVVRSREQCWLASYWNELRGTAPLPTWTDLQPDALGVPSDDLSITEVVTTDGGERFQIRFHGTRIAELYGRVNCVGKFLDEILPANASQGTLATYLHVVATGCPVYTVSDLRDRAGRIVHYERLLLPFSNGGLRVDRVLASLETVSPEGAFDNQGLMMSPPKAPAFALCTTVHF
jgi:hypothetical protein